MVVSLVSVGQLVSSNAGRDKKKLFLVFDIPNESFVRIVDGDTRKIDNPKKKNIKHLICYQIISGELAEKFQKGTRVSNADIRKAIQEIGELPQS